MRRKYLTILTILILIGAYLAIRQGSQVTLRSEASVVTAGSNPDADRHSKTRKADRTKEQTAKKTQGNIADIEKSFNLIGANGRITSEALRMAGLQREDSKRVERIVAEIWGKAGDDFRSRMVRLESTPENAGSVAFEIRADPEKAEQFMADLKNSLTAEFGKTTGNILFSGVHPWQYFGDFGRQDVQLTYGLAERTKSMTADEIGMFDLGRPVLQMKNFDAKTGDSLGGAEYSDPDHMRRFFGSGVDQIVAEYQSLETSKK